MSEQPDSTKSVSAEISPDDIRQAELAAKLQRIKLRTEAERAELEAEFKRAKRGRFSFDNIIIFLLILLFSGLAFALFRVYSTVQNNELLTDDLQTQVGSLEKALAQTGPLQESDAQAQSLAQQLALLRSKIDSELEANKVSIDAIRDSNNRIFFLFVFLSGVGSFFGIASWYSGRQEEREEGKRDRSMFALQEKNLEEVNTITTAIAAGATQNVESLNTMLATFQKIMDFKVAEAADVQKLVKKMKTQLDELKKAQGQQVAELLREAVALRRSRYLYTKPDFDLRRQMVEFRTKMDLMQTLVLDRHTNADSPKAEDRKYGEIYLRRGVIAYYDNDVAKSRLMLRIAERYFPPLGQGEAMPKGQRFQTAFIQFYLALIEKNYGDMAAAREHIESSYEVHGLKAEDELMTPTTRAEILSYSGDTTKAQDAIREVLERAEEIQRRRSLTLEEAVYPLRARLLLGNMHYVNEEWEQALESYEAGLTSSEDRGSLYYTHYSIAQVYRRLSNEEEARNHRLQAHSELLRAKHLESKVGLDTRIILRALAYLCTKEDKPVKAKQYGEACRAEWAKICETDGLQLRLFSFEKKRQVSKDEFLAEIFSV